MVIFSILFIPIMPKLGISLSVSTAYSIQRLLDQPHRLWIAWDHREIVSPAVWASRVMHRRSNCFAVRT